MMVEENLEGILTGLFPNIPVGQFSIDWISNSPRTTADSVREVYKFLRSKGLSDEKIASRAELLGRDPETIDRNYKALQRLGLSDEKIASQAHLLGMNPETIDRNYQRHVGLLRQDYRNRSSGRDLLITYAQLLGIPPNTIESNVQFLHNMGVDYNSGILLGTKTQTKRQKMAWMLRELFDYRNTSQDKKREAIGGLYDFIRDNPTILTKSINSMERNKDTLLEKVAPYRR